MLQKVSDHNLKETVLEFKTTNDIESFRNIAGLWMMENARLRYKLEDDEISELFLTFHAKARSCIDFYITKGYTDLPAFLSVYTKHMVLNILRKRRRLYTEEYLQLWQEERINKDTEELIHQSSTDKIQNCLKEVSSLGRIIVSLRFNIKMTDDDLRILYKYLQKQNKPSMSFHREYENRVLLRKEKRESLMVNLNTCNRKIYNSLDSYPISAKKRKKKLLHLLLNTHIIYSIKEMSELLSLSRHQTGRLYRNSLEIIKLKINQADKSMQFVA
jgi:hypothetical protein